jgi:ribose 5-phosphate isomerase A
MNPKKLAAEKAVQFIKDGMIVGLGTGSTTYWAIQRIGERVQEGLMIKAVASSKSSEALASQLGIPLAAFSEINGIDVTIDGADEADQEFNLIKGGGGALLREKILAANSDKFIVIIDESKSVTKLGKFPLPVEIVLFASELTIRKLESLHCQPIIRLKGDKPFITDNGNIIVDCHFNEIINPAALHEEINSIPGVIDNGLFIKMTSTIIIGNENGTTRLL